MARDEQLRRDLEVDISTQQRATLSEGHIFGIYTSLPYWFSEVAVISLKGTSPFLLIDRLTMT